MLSNFKLPYRSKLLQGAGMLIAAYYNIFSPHNFAESNMMFLFRISPTGPHGTRYCTQGKRILDLHFTLGPSTAASGGNIGVDLWQPKCQHLFKVYDYTSLSTGVLRTVSFSRRIHPISRNRHIFFNADKSSVKCITYSSTGTVSLDYPTRVQELQNTVI